MTETKWLTIAEASLLSSEMGLDRTTKTIRAWARNGHVEATKKSTAKGEMWILDKASLETKINTEIEYRDQADAVQTRANPSEPVQTGADRFEPVRPEANPFDPRYGQDKGSDEGSNPREPRSHPSDRSRIRELENEVMTLKIDKGWRDKWLERQGEEIKLGQENLHAQARYIGHLESDLLRLGGKPDQTFLAAPTPNKQSEMSRSAVEPEIVPPHRPHPDQGSLQRNQWG